ncbi:MAG: M15 family metallopeptidase [Pseudomonadota bacterium]
MTQSINSAQLTGRAADHLQPLAGGHHLMPAAAMAYSKLQQAGREAGFELTIASSFRSYDRQLAIWNGKASGARAVHDDDGQPVAVDALPPEEKLRAILRYSALPGSSRHHWGTDLDVYDAAAVESDYRVQLSPQEVAAGGVFDAMHCWLDERMAVGESFGFYRPYKTDRGGVAPERWHLSYAPIAAHCESRLSQDVLKACWLDCAEGEERLLLYDQVLAELPHIVTAFVQVAPDWCPAPYRQHATAD